MKDAKGHGSDTRDGGGAPDVRAQIMGKVAGGIIFPRGTYTRDERQRQINELADKLATLYGKKFDRRQFVITANREFPSGIAPHAGRKSVGTNAATGKRSNATRQSRGGGDGGGAGAAMPKGMKRGKRH